ncbi:hypothetical protein ACFZDJ_48075 [Streptomyces sp. NPDC007896]|uniref:hypothetical protein n=1 Tax=Streptomyces sp. NPDC007896 TaxID=3364784 RepID=UPI0036E33C89
MSATASAVAIAHRVRHRRGYPLLEWIRQAEQDASKPMQGFAGLLRQDLDAVTVGLTRPWSSGLEVIGDHDLNQPSRDCDHVAPRWSI